MREREDLFPINQKVMINQVEKKRGGDDLYIFKGGKNLRTIGRGVAE